MSQPRPRPLVRRLGLSGALLSTTLLAGCVLVRIDGPLPHRSEGSWIVSVVHGGSTPPGFVHGDPELSIVANLLGKKGRLELDFACDEGELEGYLDGVVEELRIAMEDERGARDVRVSALDGHGRRLEYEGDEDGRFDVLVDEPEDPSRYTHRLEIRWRES